MAKDRGQLDGQGFDPFTFRTVDGQDSESPMALVEWASIEISNVHSLLVKLFVLNVSRVWPARFSVRQRAAPTTRSAAETGRATCSLVSPRSKVQNSHKDSTNHFGVPSPYFTRPIVIFRFPHYVQLTGLFPPLTFFFFFFLLFRSSKGGAAPDVNGEAVSISSVRC